jgi:hypothetical protein
MLPGFIFALTAIANCNPVDGEAQLWANANTRYVLVGEVHGTAETPALFGDLVCAAHASGRPVVVGVEAADTEQGAIDRFMASDGGEAAKAAFLQSPIWSSQIKDGRSSRAYFRLFERLRRYKQSGQIAEVVAIQAVGRTHSQTENNAMTADRISAAAERRPGAIELVLIGNVHASKGAFDFGTEHVVPAAADLPPQETISLNVIFGGEAWNCRVGSDCGPHQWGAPRAEPRSVRLDRPDPPRYDGAIYLGVPTIASPPAAP